MQEIWKPIRGYEGLYEVSNFGRIKSFPRKFNPRTKLLTVGARFDGKYRQIDLCRDGHKEGKLIHHIVLEAFRGSRPRGKEGRHLDGDLSNNRLDNLVWGTKIEQCADKRRHGTLVAGNKHPRTHPHLTLAVIAEIIASSRSQRELAREYGVSQYCIWEIKNSKHWRQRRV